MYLYTVAFMWYTLIYIVAAFVSTRPSLAHLLNQPLPIKYTSLISSIIELTVRETSAVSLFISIPKPYKVSHQQLKYIVIYLGRSMLAIIL